MVRQLVVSGCTYNLQTPNNDLTRFCWYHAVAGLLSCRDLKDHTAPLNREVRCYHHHQRRFFHKDDSNDVQLYASMQKLFHQGRYYLGIVREDRTDLLSPGSKERSDMEKFQQQLESLVNSAPEWSISPIHPSLHDHLQINFKLKRITMASPSVEACEYVFHKMVPLYNDKFHHSVGIKTDVEFPLSVADRLYARMTGAKVVVSSYLSTGRLAAVTRQ